MDLLALAAVSCVMFAFVLGMAGFFQAATGPRRDMERRLGSLVAESVGGELVMPGFQTARERRIGRVPIISTLLRGKSWVSEISDELDRAGLKLTASEFISIRVLLMLVGGLVATFALGTGIIGIGAIAVAGFIGFKLPVFYVTFAQSRRVRQLEVQLLEMLSLVSNSLKAGFGLMQSLDLASRELPDPISMELRRLLYDINIGVPSGSALEALAKRTLSKDFEIVITAILVQQSTGGNLSEILDNVAHTMRERVRIRGEIKTLTSQQMLTGFIIGGLPFIMVGLFTVISPEYMVPLFTTVIGRVMLFGAALLETFGILLIKKILTIEV
jgi:tight adherence protein B